MESLVLGLAPPCTAELRTIWLLPSSADISTPRRSSSSRLRFKQDGACSESPIRVGGGEQRVFTMPGAAGTAPGMPARGLEGAQAGVRGSSTWIVVKCHSCIGESSSYVRLA
jgi:hypothetical protein